eukprot:Hpha_TRINITY_DN4922_c0_g1::TRINITY_DN4922_c0_g1_i1::g.51321::m.51321/K14442/DHX36, RHAU; ATP-dependent RNA helicase DHX36
MGGKGKGAWYAWYYGGVGKGPKTPEDAKRVELGALILRRRLEAIGGAARLDGLAAALTQEERFELEQVGRRHRRIETTVKWVLRQEAASKEGMRLFEKNVVYMEGCMDKVWSLRDGFVNINPLRVREALEAMRRWRRKAGAYREDDAHGPQEEGSVLRKLAQRPLAPEDIDKVEQAPLFKARSRLPMWGAREEMRDACSGPTGEVVLVLGATGCGKTTQAPQFILDDAIRAGQHCLILATQPRRISTMAVAERVADERGERIGESVGYKMRFEESASARTHLLFCTVGTVLRFMAGNPELRGVTHLVIDEVHERGLHTDVLLTLVRDLLRGPRRHDLRVILMSATVDPTPFRQFFGGLHMVEVPGKTNYPIEELWLEDILLRCTPNHQPLQPRRPRGGWGAAGYDQVPGAGMLPGLPVSSDQVVRAMGQQYASVADKLATYHCASGEYIDYGLVQAVIDKIHVSGGEGAVLVFLPGWGEIKEVITLLEQSRHATQYQVLPLHSRVPMKEQARVFHSPPAGQRKIILATVIAETSITVEDVVFVVDCGKSRMTFFIGDLGISSLRTVWAARSNCTQRRGRAGRCRPGVWFKLYSSLQWDRLDDFVEPEMVRTPVEEIALDIAAQNLGPIVALLRKCPSPPPEDHLHLALSTLWCLGALQSPDGAQGVTPLGKQLARLGVHPVLGKMLLLGGLFRCLNYSASVCAGLGYKTPFVFPLGKEREADEAKRWLAKGSKSDHIALVRALQGYEKSGPRFAHDNFLSPPTMEHILRLKRELLQNCGSLGITPADDHQDDAFLTEVLRAVLVAGLFPRLAQVKRRGGKCDSLFKRTRRWALHPSSVNSRVGGETVVYYEVQQVNTDTYLYDTSVVELPAVLLLCPELQPQSGSGVWITAPAGSGAPAGHAQFFIDDGVLKELQELRELLQEFLFRCVGKRVGPEEAEAVEALCILFKEHATVRDGDDDDDEDDEGNNSPRDRDRDDRKGYKGGGKGFGKGGKGKGRKGGKGGW